MAEVRLSHAQLAHRGLPPVCAACGAAAVKFRRRWFIETPGRNVPFALLGTWRYNRITLDVPFCANHLSYFTRRWVPIALPGLVVMAASVAFYVVTDITRGPTQAKAISGTVTCAVFGALALLYVIGYFVQQNSIRVSQADGDGFTMCNVSDEFAAASRVIGS